MEELAREVISEEEDDAVVAAARRLLSAIDEVQDSKGAFRITDEQIRFTAPRNFSGSTVYYRITVESDETGEVLFTLDISVSSERDPVTEAFNDLSDAITNAQKNQNTDDADADEEEDQNG